jgi:hypothetical protein
MTYFLQLVLAGLLFFSNLANACTAFGVITPEGTLLGKNRDYLYGKQLFELVQPLKQFYGWYGNSYDHQNTFYALIADNDVKFGINEAGLAAIEEDPPFPENAKAHRRYIQPYTGYSEGMVLYGLLQNFNTVQEIIPFIDKIFSQAAPNYYQIADGQSILTVEVGYGTSDNDPKRPYTYTLLDKTGDSFTHTNTFLNPTFTDLNKLARSEDSVKGSHHRLEKITALLDASKQDFSHAFDWYLDTTSSIGSTQDKNYCLNTSIFRSNTKELTTIGRNTASDKVYGTVSSFMVEHKDHATWVNVRILDSLKTLPSGDQQIVFKELKISLTDLFKNKPLVFKTRYMTRKAPKDGMCQ